MTRKKLFLGTKSALCLLPLLPRLGPSLVLVNYYYYYLKKYAVVFCWNWISARYARIQDSKKSDTDFDAHGAKREGDGNIAGEKTCCTTNTLPHIRGPTKLNGNKSWKNKLELTWWKINGRLFFGGTHSKRIQTHTFFCSQKSDLQRRRRRRLLNFFLLQSQSGDRKDIIFTAHVYGGKPARFLGRSTPFPWKNLPQLHLFSNLSLRNPTPLVFSMSVAPPFSPSQPTLRCLGKRTKKRGRKKFSFSKYSKTFKDKSTRKYLYTHIYNVYAFKSGQNR